MPSTTRQATPGPSNTVLTPANTRKRASLEETSDVDSRILKKQRTDSSTKPSKDKKKRKRKRRKTSLVTEMDTRARSNSLSVGSRRSASVKPSSTEELADSDAEADVVETLAKLPSPSIEAVNSPVAEAQSSTSEEDAATIKRLKAELEAQSALVRDLRKHERAMATVQQSLMCQICLDLLYKPYALAPCGHITCHSCLVAWFTSTEQQEGAAAQPSRPNRTFYTRKKTCPHCRAIVRERPVEVWAIKSMVSSLSTSDVFVDIPGAPPVEQNNSNDNDPWKGIFRPEPHHHWPADPWDADPRRDLPPEDVGMLDTEDGGIYRCLDCMHEIWDGVCSGCHRAYHGHDGHDDEESLIGAPDFTAMDFWGPREDEDDDEDDEDGEIPFIGGVHFRDLPPAGIFGNLMRRMLENGDIGSQWQWHRRPIDLDEEVGSEAMSGAEDEEGEYDGSFIDDGSERENDEVEVVDIDSNDNRRRNTNAQPTEVIEVSDTDEVDDDVLAGRSGQSRRLRSLSISSDSEDEGPSTAARNLGTGMRLGGHHGGTSAHTLFTQDEGPSAAARNLGTGMRLGGHHGRTPAHMLFTEDEDEEDHDPRAAARHLGRRMRLGQAGRSFSYHDDEEEEPEDHDHNDDEENDHGRATSTLRGYGYDYDDDEIDEASVDGYGSEDFEEDGEEEDGHYGSRHENDDGSLAGPPLHLRSHFNGGGTSGGCGRRTRYRLDSEEEEDEDY
ncbi:hypothetical protein D9758_009409 [Tetrapyrgos nigripes]|uniref:RING-type domain-containing protein n=1 Tax=Tetrapyrgos nigripes TaxID=182062 RepID=A0A8H5FX67_9AGAR|nr:hypothetical protein D9758_009409 [Tetrapyrgos nigripes]